MSDQIRLRGISALGRHGVLPSERVTAQPFVVDIDLEVDLAPAGRSDDLADTIDYSEVAADVVEIIHGRSVDLIEHLAERIAQRCLERPGVAATRVTVHKPQAPVGVAFDDVAVRIERSHRRPVVIALGGNLGRVEATLAAAVGRLARLDGLDLVAVSDLYRSDPVGGPEQPAYLNAVAVGFTRLAPAAVLRALHIIEDDFGRTRLERWGPRTLDLDLIQVGDPATNSDLRSSDPALTLPHPRAYERAFVLVPWANAAPEAMLRTETGVRSVAELVAALGGNPAAATLPPGIRPGPAWSPRW